MCCLPLTGGGKKLLFLLVTPIHAYETFGRRRGADGLNLNIAPWFCFFFEGKKSQNLSSLAVMEVFIARSNWQTTISLIFTAFFDGKTEINLLSSTHMWWHSLCGICQQLLIMCLYWCRVFGSKLKMRVRGNLSHSCLCNLKSDRGKRTFFLFWG